MVAEVSDWEGKGRRLPPLDYTNQTVVSISDFADEIEKERKRVIDMPRLFGGIGKGYEDMANGTTIGTSGKPLWQEKIKEVIETRSNRPCQSYDHGVQNNFRENSSCRRLHDVSRCS